MSEDLRLRAWRRALYKACPDTAVAKFTRALAELVNEDKEKASSKARQ